MHGTVKDILAKKLPKSKLQYAPRSFDIIGEIAIVDVKKEVKKYQMQIADAIMKIHKNVRTVAVKTSAVREKYRVRGIKAIAGEKNTETIYREHGCKMKLDVAKAYFSPRLSNERKRIAKVVKPNENVLVFFAGVGPYALVIGRMHKLANVIGVEWNPDAAKYFEENIRLNHLENVRAIKGDVRRQAAKFASWADRIIMPSPSNAEKFLASAFKAAKNGCIVHFYNFAKEDSPFAQAKEFIGKAAAKSGCKARITGETIVHPYAPRIVQVCVDFLVKK